MNPQPIIINIQGRQRHEASINLIGWVNLALMGYLVFMGLMSPTSQQHSTNLVSQGNAGVLSNPESHQLSQLFASLDSPGVIAICAAEGNCKPDGTKTSIYRGHKDPGNGRWNMGFCSDQGRGGGNLQKADQACLERLQSREARIQQKFREAGLEPSQHLEAYVNALDLWNQASPSRSDVFPATYAKALSKGMKGEQALVWARVESFREDDGSLGGYGLQAICRRDSRRTLSIWDCIARDQRRRVRAIHQTLRR